MCSTSFKTNNDSKHKDIDNAIEKLNDCLVDFQDTFHELEKDRDNVSTCKKVLEIMINKGFAVGSSFKDLDNQSQEFEEYIIDYKAEFLHLCTKLCELYVQMRNDADKLGPLDDITHVFK